MGFVKKAGKVIEMFKTNGVNKVRFCLNYLKKFLFILVVFCIAACAGYCADSEKSSSVQMSFYIAPYTQITPVTSPVLTAHITDTTGNLYSPLSTTFRVITNSPENKALYLKAIVNTLDGCEEAMFEHGGQVYVAFANLKNMPTAHSLANCKLASEPNSSPGVVAYPITSITGTETQKYLKSKNKYELEVKGGTSFVSVNIGSNVLKTSFGGNDPRGFYQAVICLTETDI